MVMAVAVAINFLTWSKDHTVVNSLSDKGRLCGLEGRGATLATTGDDAWHARQHLKIFVNGRCNSAMRASRRARGIAAGGGNNGAPPAEPGLPDGLPNPGRPGGFVFACEVRWCPGPPPGVQAMA